MTAGRFIPLASRPEYSPEEMQQRAPSFWDEMQNRRSVRDFSSQPVPRGTIEACLRAVGSAPSGANKQPWHFVAVSDPAVKRRIREAAEADMHPEPAWISQSHSGPAGERATLCCARRGAAGLRSCRARYAEEATG